jgi:GH24 family phage-related lysozyme (muramidase)
MMRRRKWSNLWPAKFIGRWEGLLLEAYLDTIAVPPRWTIGFGWTGMIRDKVTGKLRALRAGDRISKRYATLLLARGIRKANRELSRWLEVPVTARQRIALL